MAANEKAIRCVHLICPAQRSSKPGRRAERATNDLAADLGVQIHFAGRLMTNKTFSHVFPVLPHAW